MNSDKQVQFYRDRDGVKPWWWDFLAALGLRHHWQLIDSFVAYDDILQGIRNSYKPCKGENVNVCVAEGCYDEACLKC